jgi:hypothetical protein
MLQTLVAQPMFITVMIVILNLCLCEIKGSHGVTSVVGDVSPLEINQYIR